MSSLGIFNKETKTYQKVAGTAEAAVLDAVMSDTSENPVQNKVIKKYVDEKQVNIDGVTLTLDEAKNVIKLADALKDKIGSALQPESIVNNQVTTETGFALDARQANPNLDGTLAKQISKLNTDMLNLNFLYVRQLMDTDDEPHKLATGIYIIFDATVPEWVRELGVNLYGHLFVINQYPNNNYANVSMILLEHSMGMYYRFKNNEHDSGWMK